MRIPSSAAPSPLSDGPQFLTTQSIGAPSAAVVPTPASALPFIVLAVTIPMVIAASVVGCLWGRSKSSSGSNAGGSRSLPTAQEPKSALALQVAIPTSSLMDDRMIDQAAQGNTNHRMSVLPPPSQPLAPPPAITRNAAVPDAQTQVNPALLVQLLHAQLHRQNESTPTSPTRSSNAPSGLVTPPDTPRMGGSTPSVGSPTAPNPAFLRDRTGSSSFSAGSMQPSMILPDKTSLIRGNFEVPGIPTALPATTTMGSNYGARHLVADWDHLYQTVLTTCSKLGAAGAKSTSSARSPTSPTSSSASDPALHLVGQVALNIMQLIRTITSRQAGESLWCLLIYTHHDEYKSLPRATLLQPAEMYLAVHELMYDKPMADIVQQALADPLAQCTRSLYTLLTRAGIDAQDAKALAEPLPWATVAMVVRVKRYRPSMAFFEVSGTGQRPDGTYFTVMNAGTLTVRRRGSANQAAGEDEFDSLATVGTYVWPGVLDLAESVVRIRARVLVNV
ncbi:hypothetical protein BCR44DRAFT_53114 [Catenaria anguillulae PL171]|uniref:Uncharacterized protein n=1 Tax=Catenaria anguillulae PL171 TaxID=765915 RepID=A0A1Y2HAJ8_9FUNG|nr:hypothetical protein BCR44DRAFT_53114 [Catenaria anguillulae PL171]